MRYSAYHARIAFLHLSNVIISLLILENYYSNKRKGKTMNRVTTGALQSITIEVGNELILEDPDFRAEAIREDRIRDFVHQKYSRRN